MYLRSRFHGNNGYIGRSPGDSAKVTVACQVYQPTGIQTSFEFASGYDILYFDVYINGAKQIRGIDYSVALIIEILHLQHTYNLAM